MFRRIAANRSLPDVISDNVCGDVCILPMETDNVDKKPLFIEHILVFLNQIFVLKPSREIEQVSKTIMPS